MSDKCMPLVFYSNLHLNLKTVWSFCSFLSTFIDLNSSSNGSCVLFSLDNIVFRLPGEGCSQKVYFYHLLNRPHWTALTYLHHSIHWNDIPPKYRYQCTKQQSVTPKNTVIFTFKITSLQSSDQTHLDIRNRTVGMRQQIQRSNHREITIKNPQNHSKCSLFCNKSYTPYRPQHPLRKWGHQRKNWQTPQQTKIPPQPTSGDTNTTDDQQKTKKTLDLRYSRLRWHRWMVTVPRQHNRTAN